MLSCPSARTSLRDATSECHERVDALFSRADLADSKGYGLFLTAQAAAHLAADGAIDRTTLASLLPDWAERRRGPLLLADLAELHLPLPALLAAPTLADDAALLGAVYVLEGSRLGGTLLKRSVPPRYPLRFLGAGDSALWRRLLVVLDERLTTPADRASTIATASQVFRLFEAAGHQPWRQRQLPDRRPAARPRRAVPGRDRLRRAGAESARPPRAHRRAESLDARKRRPRDGRVARQLSGRRRVAAG